MTSPAPAPSSFSSPLATPTESAAPTPARRRGRPPASDGQRRDTREALIRYGTELLTEQGFLSTGIDAVLKHLSVPKGSFYHYFPSKQAFGHAVIDNYGHYFARKLDRHLLDDSLPPLRRIARFIDDAKAGMARHAYRRGCLIGNLSQELSASHDDFRERLEAVFRDWQARLAACLAAARAAGDIAADADCDRLAAFFWIGWEGAVMRARLVRNDQPLTLFAEQFFLSLPR